MEIELLCGNWSWSRWGFVVVYAGIAFFSVLRRARELGLVG